MTSSLQAKAARTLLWRRRTGGTNTGNRYADDPVGFAMHVLGVEPWSRQAEMLRLVLENDYSAIKAGRKVSKSNSVAILAVWWAVARGGRAFLTSSTYDQIKQILWREVTNLIARAHLGVHVPLDPGTGVHFPNGGEIVGRSTNRRENMQGYSGADMLYAVDESSGVHSDIFEAIEGNLAGGGKLMLTGNPTLTSGKFYDAFHLEREFWSTMTISSRESPNVTGEREIEGLATEEWIEDQERKWGPDSSLVQIHVDGQFPTQSDDAVITLDLIEGAQKRWGGLRGPGTLQLGVDVAWTGADSTVVMPVRGLTVGEAVVMTGRDPTDVAGEVLRIAERLKRDDEKPMVKVDVIGIGAGVYSNLARSTDIRAVPVNVAERATSQPNTGGYSKLRDQLWFGIREWLIEGGELPPDPLLAGELLAAHYDYDAQGRYRVSDKDDIKARIRRSPDRADALALAVHRAPTPRVSLI